MRQNSLILTFVMLNQINLPPDIIKKEAAQIFQMVLYGESGVAMCYPACKMQYNIIRFLADKRLIKSIIGKYYNRFVFLHIYLDEGETLQSFKEKLIDEINSNAKSAKKNSGLKEMFKMLIREGRDPYLFLYNAQYVEQQDLKGIIREIHGQITSLNRLGALIFFESNIYNSEIFQILKIYNQFLKSILVFPSYSNSVSEYFVNSLAHEWGIKLDSKTIHKVISLAPGYLWVLREYVRHIREKNKIDIEVISKSPGIKMRTKTIYDMFSKEEKESLSDLCFGDSAKVSKSDKEYFSEVGFVKKKGNKYIVTLKLLEDLIENDIHSHKLNLDKDNNVLYGGKNIDYDFTEKELKLLKQLLTKRGTVVSRENIAQTIWGNLWDERYSDWAIDKLMSRLRISLIKIGLPKNIIVTKKGKGFILN